MPRPGVTLPVVDYLAPLPSVALDGSCVVSDPTGNGRYAYILLPTAADNWMFARMDLYSRTAQVLATPTRAATTITARAKMIYDPNDGTNNTGSVWLICPESAGPWMRWQRYDVVADTWTARANIAGLAAALATDLSLAHVSRLVGGVPANADFVYCNGDGGVFGGAGISNLARYQISTNTWALVTGAGGVRAGAPAIGSSLDGLPLLPTYLFSFRGGGAGVLDFYDITTDAWQTVVAANINPTMTWDLEGFETTTSTKYPLRLFCASLGQINSLDLTPFTAGALPGALTNDLVCSIDGTDGATHQGLGLFWWSVGDRVYLGIRPHSGTVVQRIRLIR